MVYLYTFFALSILFYELVALWQEKSKDWTMIITVLFLTSLSTSYVVLDYFEFIHIPPFTNLINTFFKTLLPSFYDFMSL